MISLGCEVREVEVTLGSVSMSIPEDFDFSNDAFSLSIAAKRAFAVGFMGAYVSMITLVRISEVRRLRTDDIERRTRSVNRGSNRITARSRSA